MTCSICGGNKHVLVDGIWGRCSCLYKETLFKTCKSLVSQKHFENLLKGIFPSLPPNVRPRLEKCRERFIHGENPSNPIIVFGSEEFRKKIEASFWQIAFSNHIECSSIQMFDLIDAYFNDSKQFRSFLSNRILMIHLGAEVKNMGAVLTFNAILVMRLAYPVFFSSYSNRQAFLLSYPDELKETFSQFHLVELK